MATKRKKTVVVRHGSATVRIFYAPTGKYKAWQVSYSFNGQRIRKKYSDLKRAKAEALKVAKRLDRGDTILFDMTKADAASYAAAVNHLYPTGKSLETACAEYAEAVRNLNGTALADVVADYLRRNPPDAPKVMVSEAVAELLEARAKENVSAVHLRDLRLRLARFADSFVMPVRQVTSDGIAAWLDSLPVGPRSRNNYRLVLANLFNWCKRRRYLPPGWDEMARITPVKMPKEEIGIFKPTAMKKLLCASSERLRPLLVLGAFAGLRTSEVTRLDWSAVHFETGHVVVPVQSKTGRRLAPILDNARAWLEPLAKPSGPVCSLRNTASPCGRLAKKAGVEWVHNGLRHSFVSYRVAAVQSLEQVSMECGHSVTELRASYRELVTPKQADEWFSIAPKTHQKKK